MAFHMEPPRFLFFNSAARFLRTNLSDSTRSLNALHAKTPGVRCISVARVLRESAPRVRFVQYVIA